MSFQGPDRRLRARFRARLPFVLKGNGNEVRGITRNVSLLGISAYTQGSILRGQPVQCLLELPSQPQSPLIARGTVIRCEPTSSEQSDGDHEVGVFFRLFEEEGEATLSKYLRHIAQEEQQTIQAGYRVLKKRLAARRNRKRLEELRKKRRRQVRLRRRKRRLAQQKRLAAQRRKKRAKGSRKSPIARRSR